MKLQFWKKPSAPAVEHEQSLAQTRDLHRAAQEALDVVTVAFDDDPSASNEKAVLAARHEVERLALHVERAERLLETSKAREAAEQRAALLAEIEALREELSYEAVQVSVAETLAAEAALIQRLAVSRLRRREMGRELDRKHNRLLDLCQTVASEPGTSSSPALCVSSNVCMRDAVKQLPCDGDLAREVAEVGAKLYGVTP